MPALYDRGYQAVRAGIAAARRVWADPRNTVTVPVPARVPYYDRMWSFYSNDAFGDLAAWAAYRELNWLYDKLRSLYNPTWRIVEFYVGAVYPGVLVKTPEMPPDVPIAVPLAKATPAPLVKALQQFWQWTNWQDQKDIMVRYAGALGNTLVELDDDLTRRKVTSRVWWPGNIVDLDVDATGNVKAYELEYEEDDPDQPGSTYRFGKRVTADRISFFKNGDPFNYSTTPGQDSYRNPYGFVPAVWVRHFNMGDDFGMPVMWASLVKLDEINALASMAHDNLAKLLTAPVFMSGPAPTSNSRRLEQDARRPENTPIDMKQRADARVVYTAEGSALQSFPVDMGESLAWLNNLIAEVEHDHPELTMYQKLREMQSVTGPGANALMGDVGNLVLKAEGGYDLATQKLAQMAIAIAGFRANDKAWGERSKLTPAQQAFLPFNLDSYAKGDLNFDILPRLVIKETALDVWQIENAKLDALTKKKALGFTDEQIQREAGADDQQIQEIQDAGGSATDLGAALLAFNRGGAASGVQMPPMPPASVAPGAPSGNLPPGSPAPGMVTGRNGSGG